MRNKWIEMRFSGPGSNSAATQIAEFMNKHGLKPGEVLVIGQNGEFSNNATTILYYSEVPLEA